MRGWVIKKLIVMIMLIGITEVWAADASLIEEYHTSWSGNTGGVVADDVDDDGVIEIIHRGFVPPPYYPDIVSDRNLIIWNWDGEVLNWELDTTYNYIYDGQPWPASFQGIFVNDVDNDGVKEILTGGLYIYIKTLPSGKKDTLSYPLLLIWHWDGGSLTLEESYTWGQDREGSTTIYEVYADDIDKDGVTEILLACNIWSPDYDAEFMILTYDGDSITTEHVERWATSDDTGGVERIATGDVDSDGDIEIITGGFTGVHGRLGELRIMTWDGNIFNLEHSETWNRNGNHHSPGVYVYDVDKDGTTEIITVGGYRIDTTTSVSRAQLQIWNWDGVNLSNECWWEDTPEGQPSWIYGMYPYDIDGDNDIELLLGGYYEGWPWFNIKQWDGTTLYDEYFNASFSYLCAVNYQFTVCDVDNDGVKEVIFACGNSYSQSNELWIWHDGTPPEAPTGLSIIEIYYTRLPPNGPCYFLVHLDWNSNTESDLAAYNLYRRISPYESDFTRVKCVDSSETWDTVMQYPPYYPGYGVYVYYYVTAYDIAANESEPSNTVGFWMWPPSEPGSPASAKFIIAGLGNPEPSPYLVQRAGYRVIDSNHDINLYPEYSVDYHPDKLIYRFTGLDPAKEYWIAAILCRGHDDPATIERMHMDGIPVLTNLTVVDTPRLVYHRIPHILYTDSAITIELQRVSGGPAMASELILAEVTYTPGFGGGMTSNEITKFDISEVSPNPATSHVTIKLAVPYRAYVRLNIYDVTGRLVKPLVNSMLNPGYHTVKWDIENVPMGIYFLKLQNERLAVTKKLVIIK